MVNMNKRKNQENLCLVREKKDVISLLTLEWMHIAAQAKTGTCKWSAGSEKSSSVKKRPVYGYFLHYRAEMELYVWSRAFIDTEATLTFILHTSSYSALKIQSTARSMNTKMYECTWTYPAGWASNKFLLCQNVMPQNNQFNIYWG